MKKLFPLTLVAASLLVVGCSNSSNDDKTTPTACEAAESCSTFTVLHTNDNHGRFWTNKRGEYGMAARKTLIDSIRSEVEAKGGEVLVLSGGDINTGVPESDLQDAVPDFLGMNMIKYDAMAVGNHEFDNPLTTLELQRRIASFPMLAANIYHEVDGERVRYFEPYKVFTKDGLRIAVIGLTTEDTVRIGNPEFISDLEFTDPKEEIKTVIDEINAGDKADVIFATTHMGHYANASSGSNAPGDVALARALEEGQLQAIIGGHSQNPVCMEPGVENEYADFNPGDECTPDQQKGAYIMQAHEWGKYVGRADFEYYGGELHLADYRLIPVNLKRKVKDTDGNTTYILIENQISEDSSVKAVLQPYQETGQELLDEQIGTTNGKLIGDRSIVRKEQTNLGRLIAKAQSNHPNINADFGVMNSGGVRADIEEGVITYRDVLTVQPFGNIINKATMNGADAQKYLTALALKTSGSGAYAQITDVKMAVDCSAKSVVISEINGNTFDAAAMYSFTIPSFNAAGGDGYPKLTGQADEGLDVDDFTSLELLNTGFVDADVLKNFIEVTGAIDAAAFAPVVGNITYSNSLDSSDKGCGPAPKPTDTPAS